MVVLPDLNLTVNDEAAPAYDNGRYDVAAYGGTSSPLNAADTESSERQYERSPNETVTVASLVFEYLNTLIFPVYDNISFFGQSSTYDNANAKYDTSLYRDVADFDHTADQLPIGITRVHEIDKQINILLDVDDPNTAGNVLSLNEQEFLEITDLDRNLAAYGKAYYNIDQYGGFADTMACILEITKALNESFTTNLLASVIANYDYSLYNANMESATPSVDNYEQVREHGTAIHLYYTHYPEIELDGRVNFQTVSDDVSFGWAYTNDLNQRNREVLRKQE